MKKARDNLPTADHATPTLVAGGRGRPDGSDDELVITSSVYTITSSVSFHNLFFSVSGFLQSPRERQREKERLKRQPLPQTHK